MGRKMNQIPTHRDHEERRVTLGLYLHYQRLNCILQMSSSTSKPAESSNAPEQPKAENPPHLSVLEEDDEFEEFPVAGMLGACDVQYLTYEFVFRLE